MIILILMFKVRDHCHITVKKRGPGNRDCNTNLKLNHKFPIVFHNLKKCFSFYYATTTETQS